MANRTKKSMACSGCLSWSIWKNFVPVFMRALIGLVVAFLASMFFAKDLWNVVQSPARVALEHLGIHPPNLVYITPMEGFNIIWLKMPLLISIFLGIAVDFVSGLGFRLARTVQARKTMGGAVRLVYRRTFHPGGGCFAYFVVFRFRAGIFARNRT